MKSLIYFTPGDFLNITFRIRICTFTLAKNVAKQSEAKKIMEKINMDKNAQFWGLKT